MSKIIIVEPNSNDKDQTRNYFIKGERGYSAYELYVQHGGTLTEEEWLDEFTNADNFYNKGDFAVVTGSLTLSDGVASGTVSYPTGFTKDNCIVLSFMAKNTNGSSYGYGYIENSAGYTNGAIGHRISLGTDNISVGINNPTDSHSTGTATFDYKILLLKIS